jgi:hypothetical protein
LTSTSEENTQRKQKKRGKAHGTSDESDTDCPPGPPPLKKSLKRKQKAKVAVEVVLDDEDKVECLDDKADVDCCDSLLNCAVVALNTRRGGLKVKCNNVDVEQDEGSVQSYQHKEDVQ